jgi:predicted anti-sigma-YlaC factor YlaD
MLDQAVKNICPLPELSAYIDGELTASEEFAIDEHLVNCALCRDDLNLQKQFLCALSQSLEGGDDVELPADFTKVVVANAESHVAGLRRPSERFNAAFVCSALVLAVMVAVGADSGTGTFIAMLDKAAAVGGFLLHTTYDVAVGAVIVLRSISSQFLYNSPLSFSASVFLASMAFIVSKLSALLGRG